jgi:hypothetical protein
MYLIEKYLGEEQNIVSKALALPEPKVGGEYPSEKVKRYLKIIDNAIKAMMKKEESDKNDAIMEDLRDKKSKWKNVDKETEPTKTKLELPPDQEEEPPPPPQGKGQDQEEEER